MSVFKKQNLIWLFIWLTLSCSDNTSLGDPVQSNIVIDNFATFYPLPLAEELLDEVRLGELKYVLLRFNSLPKVHKSELYEYTYYVDKNTLLVRVDENFDPSLFSGLKSVGKINPIVKYNQNVNEYIIPRLEGGQPNVIVLIDFYEGVKQEEIEKTLYQKGIEFKVPLNYSKYSAVAKITSPNEIKSLLSENIVKEIFYSKILDSYYDKLESGDFPWTYKCGGSMTPYGSKLSYSMMEVDGMSNSHLKYTLFGNGGWINPFHNNISGNCVFLTYHTDGGNSNARDVDGNSFNGSGDYSWQQAFTAKTYWDPKYNTALESAFLEWQVSSGAGFRFTHANQANGYGDIPIENGIHITFEEKNEYPTVFAWQNRNVPALSYSPDGGEATEQIHFGAGQIFLNGEIRWSLQPNYSSLNIAHFGAVITHEIGHVLGLDHFNNIDVNTGRPLSIMFDPGMFAEGIGPSGGVTQDPNKGVTNIYPDDINGVNFLYPSNSCCTNCNSQFIYDGNNCYSGLHFDSTWDPFIYGNSFYVKAKSGNNCPPGFTYDGVNCYSGIHFDPSKVSPFIYGNSFYTSSFCN